MIRGFLAVLATLAGLGLCGCGPQPGDERDGGGGAEPGAKPLRVVCTVAMVSDVVREVAGDRAVVSGLIGAGVDPHLYKPTRNDVAALMDADMIFYVGLMLEGKMASTLEKFAKGGKSVVAVTERIEKQYLLHPDGSEGHPDPHVWMDVRAWAKGVDVVVAAFSGHDPEHASVYRANGDRLLGEMANLAEYADATLASIPAEQRVLITAHDAFNYFGRAHDLEVMGIQGLSTESEAGLDDINGLVDLIVKRGIGAIFVETSVSDRNVKALIEGARSRGATVGVGGTLFSDAMGEAGTYEGTYLGMIDHNVTTIARALGGKAPEKGMAGRLAGVE